MKKLFMFLGIVAFITPANAMDEDIFTVNNESEEKLGISAQIKIRNPNAQQGQSRLLYFSFKIEVRPDEMKSYKRSDFWNTARYIV